MRGREHEQRERQRDVGEQPELEQALAGKLVVEVALGLDQIRELVVLGVRTSGGVVDFSGREALQRLFG